MKSFDLAKMAAAQGGEYVLAAKDLHTEACYLVYGLLKPGEGDRLIQPGKGYEEILCAMTGALMMKLAAERSYIGTRPRRAYQLC